MKKEKKYKKWNCIDSAAKKEREKILRALRKGEKNWKSSKEVVQHVKYSLIRAEKNKLWKFYVMNFMIVDFDVAFEQDFIFW